jgi:hypothetical protein
MTYAVDTPPFYPGTRADLAVSPLRPGARHAFVAVSFQSSRARYRNVAHAGGDRPMAGLQAEGLMVRLVRSAVFATALAFAGAAAAQDSPQPGSQPDIVVTAERERGEQVRDFVAALAEAPGNGQLSRFEDSICPAVFGLSGPLREAVVNRMRNVAAAVGLTVAGGRCTPNLLLMVTADKRAFIQALAQRSPQYFTDEGENRARRVAAQPGSASAWHAEVRLNADGRALPMQGGVAVNQTGRAQSRIAASARPAFVAAAVVVEREALTGLSATQLADYALMRALARTDPGRLPASAPPTILRVLDAPADSEVPVSLTRWDLGFLRGLYASRANLNAAAQRGEIVRAVDAEVRRLDGTEN